MVTSVDGSELEPAQAEQARVLCSDNPPAAESRRAGGAPDSFSYELTVSDGPRSKTHHWSESEVPQGVGSLVASLAARAKPAPPA